jgi:hypothetical protein
VAATQEQLLEKNLELERAYKALEEVSLTDQLTGCATAASSCRTSMPTWR